MSGFKVADGIYHVGDTKSRIGLDCNPYLLIEGDEAVLFDPGSILDYEIVLASVEELVDLKKVKYVVLHHQDADFCSAMPLLEAKGLKATIITSWRTMTLIQYYDIRSPYSLIEENGYQLTFETGRILRFISTPYMHFPGAFATYDQKTGSLFSSDIFGAFSYNRTIYADESYIEKMLTFHEHYMPSNDIVRPVMDTFLTLGVERILPQHGALIEGKAFAEKHIKALRELECGTLLHAVKKSLMASGGYKMIFNEVYRRYRSLFDPEEVMALFESLMSFKIEGEEIVDYTGTGEAIWSAMFDRIGETKGRRWITVVEPFIKRLCTIYGLVLPNVVATIVDSVEAENVNLHQKNEKLAEIIQDVQNRLIRCPVTDLLNEVFLDSMMMKALESDDWRSIGNLALMTIDQLQDIKYQYGDTEYKDTQITFAYQLKERFGESRAFRMQNGDFAVYLPDTSKAEVLKIMDDFRTDIKDSQSFIIPLTISAGVVFSDEIELDAITYEGAMVHYKDMAMSRERYARANGRNLIWYQSVVEYEAGHVGSVLIVDSDQTNLDVLRTFLIEKGLKVLVAKDGEEAAYLAETELPTLIVSEVMLPKRDGYILRERLQSQSATKGIDMIYLSYVKDEKAIKRALSLGVTQFIKKPYMLSEVIGIIMSKVEATYLR